MPDNTSLFPDFDWANAVEESPSTIPTLPSDPTRLPPHQPPRSVELREDTLPGPGVGEFSVQPPPDVLSGIVKPPTPPKLPKQRKPKPRAPKQGLDLMEGRIPRETLETLKTLQRAGTLIQGGPLAPLYREVAQAKEAQNRQRVREVMRRTGAKQEFKEDKFQFDQTPFVDSDAKRQHLIARGSNPNLRSARAATPSEAIEQQTLFSEQEKLNKYGPVAYAIIRGGGKKLAAGPRDFLEKVFEETHFTVSGGPFNRNPAPTIFSRARDILRQERESEARVSAGLDKSGMSLAERAGMAILPEVTSQAVQMGALGALARMGRGARQVDPEFEIGAGGQAGAGIPPRPQLPSPTSGGGLQLYSKPNLPIVEGPTGPMRTFTSPYGEALEPSSVRPRTIQLPSSLATNNLTGQQQGGGLIQYEGGEGGAIYPIESPEALRQRPLPGEYGYEPPVGKVGEPGQFPLTDAIKAQNAAEARQIPGSAPVPSDPITGLPLAGPGVRAQGENLYKRKLLDAQFKLQSELGPERAKEIMVTAREGALNPQPGREDAYREARALLRDAGADFDISRVIQGLRSLAPALAPGASTQITTPAGQIAAGELRSTAGFTEQGATTTTPTHTLRLPGPGNSFQEIAVTWTDAPSGTQFSKPEHYGNVKNVLFDIGVENRPLADGSGEALMLSSIQSDWAQGPERHSHPFKNQWLQKALERAVEEGKRRGLKGILIPNTPELVATIQKFGHLTERDGKYFNYAGYDVTPVVKRYVRELPEQLAKLARREGVEVGMQTVPTENGQTAEMLFMPFKEGVTGLRSTTTNPARQSALQPGSFLPTEPGKAPIMVMPSAAIQALTGTTDPGFAFNISELPAAMNRLDMLLPPREALIAKGMLNKLVKAAQQAGVDSLLIHNADHPESIGESLYHETYHAGQQAGLVEAGKQEGIPSEQLTNLSLLYDSNWVITQPAVQKFLQSPFGQMVQQQAASDYTDVQITGVELPAYIAGGQYGEINWGMSPDNPNYITTGEALDLFMDQLRHIRNTLGPNAVEAIKAKATLRPNIQEAFNLEESMYETEQLFQSKPGVRLERFGPTVPTSAAELSTRRGESVKDAGALSGIDRAGTQRAGSRGSGEEGSGTAIGAIEGLRSLGERVPPANVDPTSWYYSQLEQVVREKFPNKVSAEQAAAMFTNPKYGIKAEEYEWSGLDKLIASKVVKGEQITKAEILETLRENQVRVEEVVLGQPLTGEKAELQEQISKATVQLDNLRQESERVEEILYNEGYFTSDRVNPPDERSAELFRQLDVINDDMEGITEFIRGANREIGESGDVRYEGWKALKGGEPGTYRELLLTLPSRPEQVPEEMGDAPRGWNSVGGQGDVANFYSSHFSEPNILAHVRFDEGKDADGNRVLRIQEFQSDWHQQGREKGYRDEALVQEYNNLSKERVRLGEIVDAAKAAEEAVIALYNESYYLQNIYYNDPEFQTGDPHFKQATFNRFTALREEYQAKIGPAKAEYDRAYANWDAVVKRMKELEPAQGKEIPNAPFKSSWHELAFKRMVRWAADNGFSRIVWPTGKSQIDLYENTLRQNVDRIKLVRGDLNLKNTYTIYAYKDGELRTQINDLTPEQVREHIGPAAANKLLNDPVFQEDRYNRAAEITGPDLSIGGQLHKLLYDEKIPQFARDLVKQFKGGGYGRTQVDVTDYRGGTFDPRDYGYDPQLEDAHYFDIPHSLQRPQEIKFKLFSHSPPAPEQQIRFKTAQGSTYTFNPTTGVSQRNKSLHPGHDPTDVGVKPPSDITVFISPVDAQKVGMWQTSSAEGQRAVIDRNKQEILLLSLNSQTGKLGLDERFTYTTNPALGKNPLELFGRSASLNQMGYEGYRGTHPGNTIIEMSGGGTAVVPPQTPDQAAARWIIDDTLKTLHRSIKPPDPQAELDAAARAYEDSKLARTQARKRLDKLKALQSQPEYLDPVKAADLERAIQLADADRQATLEASQEARKQYIEAQQRATAAQNAARAVEAQTRLNDPEKSYRVDPNVPYIEEVVNPRKGSAHKAFWEAAKDAMLAQGLHLDPNQHVTPQVLEWARQGKIPLNSIIPLLEAEGTDVPTFLNFLGESMSVAGTAQQSASVLRRLYNQMAKENPQIAEAIQKMLPSLREMNAMFRERSNLDRFLSIHAGMLTGTIMAAQRNLASSGIMVGFDTLGQMFDAGVQTAFGAGSFAARENKQPLSPYVAAKPVLNIIEEVIRSGITASARLIGKSGESPDQRALPAFRTNIGRIAKVVEEFEKAFPNEVRGPLFEVLNSDDETRLLNEQGQVNEDVLGLIARWKREAEGLPPDYKKKEKIKLALDMLEKRYMKSQTPLTRAMVRGEQLSRAFGFFNRAQETIVRRAVFEAKVRRYAQEQGFDVDSMINAGTLAELPVEIVDRAAQEALKATMAARPRLKAPGNQPQPGALEKGLWHLHTAFKKGPLGAAVQLGLYRFPGFLGNLIKYTYDYSPAGLIGAPFTPKERWKMTRGDYGAIWKGLIGVALFGMATEIRRKAYESRGANLGPDEENPVVKATRKPFEVIGNNLPPSMEVKGGEKWNELIVPGLGKIDIRFLPIAPIFLAADMFERNSRGIGAIDSADVAEVFGASKRSAGQAGDLLETAMKGIADADAEAKAGQIGGKWLGAIAAGFLTPIGQISDIIQPVVPGESIRHDLSQAGTDAEPTWQGQMKSFGEAFGAQLQEKVPIWRLSLPDRAMRTRTPSLERTEGPERALTGIPYVEDKTWLESEMDILGIEPYQIVPRTQNPKVNAVVDREMGKYMTGVGANLSQSKDFNDLPAEQRRQILLDEIFPAFHKTVLEQALAQFPEEMVKKELKEAFTKEQLNVENRRRKKAGEPGLLEGVKQQFRATPTPTPTASIPPRPRLNANP